MSTILQLLLLVDFFGCGYSVFEVDRDFVLAVVLCVLVGVVAAVAVNLVLPIVILLGEVHRYIVVVDDPI